MFNNSLAANIVERYLSWSLITLQTSQELQGVRSREWLHKGAETWHVMLMHDVMLSTCTLEMERFNESPRLMVGSAYISRHSTLPVLQTLTLLVPGYCQCLSWSRKKRDAAFLTQLVMVSLHQ
jgi:hypothetical protein